MGTHPSGPSTLHGSDVTLESVLKANPHLLTQYFYDEYHGHLPFLFKVLSINKALSIQAHPDKELAKKLYRERPAIYKDDNHKPEMAIALTEFEALCGFRPLNEISAALGAWPELSELVGREAVDTFQNALKEADVDNQRQALKQLYTAVMTAEASTVKERLDSLIHKLTSAGKEYRPQTIEELVLRIHSQFPGDVGVFSLFFLNYVVLQPGQAIFLAANEPHAYLSGGECLASEPVVAQLLCDATFHPLTMVVSVFVSTTDCVECMAASDNVVRAGLTPKFKDVEVLTQMLTYQAKSSADQLLTGVSCAPHSPHSLLYDPPIEEFSVVLTRLDHDKDKELSLIHI